jgi:glutamyl-Q tRNA(Asp) synthetase
VQSRLPDNAYRGRFAPSPTGPLHFGSLVAALGSWLDARSQTGQWLVRIEDIDRPREVPGSADRILRSLDAFGFDWDGPVLYQSRHTDAYAEALDQLRDGGLLFGCACSRKEVAAAGRLGQDGHVYPGTCRSGLPPGRKSRALRIRVESGQSVFRDRIFGDVYQDLARDVGDFVLRRSDGIHAYQLAVVVDDAFQGVTHVVRGADLLFSTPRQIFLQRAIGLPTPCYAHLPLAVDGGGRKLSKSDAAAPVDPKDPLPALLQAWNFLGQPALPERPANVAEFHEHALMSWNRSRVPAEHARFVIVGEEQ